MKKNDNEDFRNALKNEQIKLPFAPDKWCYIVPHFLTDKDCTSFINYLHKNRGKESKQRDITKVEKKKNVSLSTRMRPRGLNWTINKSEIISDLIFQRLFNFLPKIWIDQSNNTIWELSGINDDIKSLKYGVGDVLCPHFDTPYIKNGKEKTFITTVLYLNDDFIGGSFQFLDPNNLNTIHPIKIEKGTCLLFQHNTFHKGSAIQRGTKYMIRFDILYKKVDINMLNLNKKVNESKSCVWL